MSDDNSNATAPEERSGFTPKEQEAKRKLDQAIEELGRVCAGTPAQMVLPGQLLVTQVDILIDLLAETRVIDRQQFWGRISKTVQAMTDEYRRQLLSAPGLTPAQMEVIRTKSKTN